LATGPLFFALQYQYKDCTAHRESRGSSARR